MHCDKYDGFQPFFTCLDAMRGRIHASILVPIPILSQFSIEIIAHENILEQIHEASLLDTVMQTSGSILDFVGNYCENSSGNPIVSKENGVQY